MDVPEREGGGTPETQPLEDLRENLGREDGGIQKSISAVQRHDHALHLFEDLVEEVLLEAALVRLRLLRAAGTGVELRLPAVPGDESFESMVSVASLSPRGGSAKGDPTTNSLEGHF